MTPEQQQIERVVKKQKPGVLRGIPGPQKQQILELLQESAGGVAGRNVVLQQTSISSGPVPPAELLAGYNREIENGATRLFSLIERQSEHRQAMERDTITTQNIATKRGQVFGFILAIILIVVGCVFKAVGDSVLAGIVFGTTVVGLTTVFVLGRKSQERNLDKKAPK